MWGVVVCVVEYYGRRHACTHVCTVECTQELSVSVREYVYALCICSTKPFHKLVFPSISWKKNCA